MDVAISILDEPVQEWLKAEGPLLTKLALVHRKAAPEATYGPPSDDVHQGSWSARDLVRSYLLSKATGTDIETYRRRADDSEWISLLKSLAALPDPTQAKQLAGMGLRSNNIEVVRTLAHHNPFPTRMFDDGAWRQLILKCVFTDLGLQHVFQLETRRHAELNRAIFDYAYERAAANRPLNPQLWRAVLPQDDIARTVDLSHWQNRSGHQMAISKLLAGQAVSLTDCPSDKPE